MQGEKFLLTIKSNNSQFKKTFFTFSRQQKWSQHGSKGSQWHWNVGIASDEKNCNWNELIFNEFELSHA